MICHLVEKELENRTRVITESENFMSLVPFTISKQYEVHIYPKNHFSSMDEIQDLLVELGFVIQDVVRRYSRFLSETKYIMVLHSRPSVGKYPFWHFHIEFYPVIRQEFQDEISRGMESVFLTIINNSNPEDMAKDLREAC
jgi:UDPglucose--hexose-1-phosphate uridylyltransferase